MKKKLLSALVAGTMSLGVVACGEVEDDPNVDDLTDTTIGVPETTPDLGDTTDDTGLTDTTDMTSDTGDMDTTDDTGMTGDTDDMDDSSSTTAP